MPCLRTIATPRRRRASRRDARRRDDTALNVATPHSPPRRRDARRRDTTTPRSVATPRAAAAAMPTHHRDASPPRRCPPRRSPPRRHRAQRRDPPLAATSPRRSPPRCRDAAIRGHSAGRGRGRRAHLPSRRLAAAALPAATPRRRDDTIQTACAPSAAPRLWSCRWDIQFSWSRPTRPTRRSSSVSGDWRCFFFNSAAAGGCFHQQAQSALFYLPLVISNKPVSSPTPCLWHAPASAQSACPVAL